MPQGSKPLNISIWLNQAVKGARDRHGNSVQNAHLLSLFHRLCKLLFFRIRPVFVFDGEAPLLKRQTLAKRRQRKEVAATDSKKTTEKILTTFLKRQALKTALAGKRQEHTLHINADLPSLSEIRREEVDDIYVLPSLQKDTKGSSEEEDEKEWEERMTQKKMLQSPDFTKSDSVELLVVIIVQEELLENPHSVDVESEDFLSLPPEVKHEILTDMKEFTKRRRTLFEAMPEGSSDFSQYQLKGLLKKSSLNRHIEKVQKEMNEQHAGQIQSQYEEDTGFLKEVEARRVVSEDTSHYILIKGIQPKGDVVRDLVTSSAGRSSAVPEDSKPSVSIDKTPVNVNSPPGDLLKTESSGNTYLAPPSPRTVLAIQAAMLGSSSEEELEDENKSYLDSNTSGSGPSTESGNVSPRTLRAIEKALSEEEQDSRAAVRNSTGDSQGESPMDDLLASNSDEEDQSEKELPFLSVGLSGNRIIEQESKLDQREDGLAKDQSVSESPCISFVEKGPSSVSAKEERGVGTQATRTDLSCVSSAQIGNISSVMQQPIGASMKPALSVAPTVSSCEELTKNRKVDHLKELVHQPEKQASHKQHELSFTTEMATPNEEAMEHQLQSEESDSDGSFIEVDAELSGELQREISEKSPSSTEQKEGTISEYAVDIQVESKGTFEGVPEVTGKETELTGEQDSEIKGKDEDTVNEWQNISMEELEILETNLSVEQNTLLSQKRQQERIAATVTGQMFLESQELLRLFGIPYIEAPMEAEAQCAVLDLTDQTSGTITDDSDIWLFGGRHVYKNFFSQNKYVEYYQFIDFQNQLGLDRNKLINLAYLLGSDYAEGIPNVGYVTAMEILNEFPGRGMEPLFSLREWWTEAQKSTKTRPNPYDTKVKKKLRQLLLAPGFPDPAVAEAYLHPVVDESKGSFVWGRPDLEQIREYPFFSIFSEAITQLRIDSYFRLAQQEKQAIKSQRLRRAVTCMRRKEKEEEEQEASEATAAMEQEFKQGKGKHPGQGADQGMDGVPGWQGKRKKCPLATQPSSLAGGFMGEVQLSEASSDSSEDLEEEASDRREGGKTSKVLKAELGSHKTSAAVGPLQDERGHSSSSAEEEIPMVTARPVFQGKKARGKSSRRRFRK
ncbi:DNA repair protein complementing XP-G cells [Varanus komodoensis]|nr:DNA repair protein complementing XP-G cells [Varanus komodoensis]